MTRSMSLNAADSGGTFVVAAADHQGEINQYAIIVVDQTRIN